MNTKTVLSSLHSTEISNYIPCLMVKLVDIPFEKYT